VVGGGESVIRDYISEANRLMVTAPQSRWWLVFSHGWSAERSTELEGIDPRFLAGERFEAYRAAAYLFVPRAGIPAPPRDGGVP